MVVLFNVGLCVIKKYDFLLICCDCGIGNNFVMVIGI